MSTFKTFMHIKPSLHSHSKKISTAIFNGDEARIMRHGKQHLYKITPKSFRRLKTIWEDMPNESYTPFNAGLHETNYFILWEAFEPQDQLTHSITAAPSK
jgi:hypothetical protein